MKKKRVVAAMSGGVDSSVAAALLLAEGYDVVGITLNLFSPHEKDGREENKKSYWGFGAVEDARHVCLQLGIPHHEIDVRKEFEKKVIADFCSEYIKGRTPNPCIRCNALIKFEALMKMAEKLNADYLATGHYAQIEHDVFNKTHELKKGKDRQKDQSYFLYTLTQNQLNRILMPVGSFTKKQIRKKAAELGLTVARRPESQEICFVPERNYSRFLRLRMPKAFQPGPVVDSEGRTIGRHEGIPGFTVGQRRGMGIASPFPLYVLSIDVETNTVTAGPNEALYRKELLASNVNIVSGIPLKEPLRVKAKIRYNHREAAAVLDPEAGGRVRVRFDTSQRAVTPGQAVVFYDGETVIGGGVIEKSLEG
jgi:tRNA-specific 2-thiouridylase